MIGIPIGAICVETRSTETVTWAVPALETSQEEIVKEAGQVWYPNSAFKTAQAIKDFNNGEQLPLIIFANWRGFSGGQSDMFKEILKFGAEIVDALCDFKQPIFIYIVGELRGGAWVVVDPTINPNMMEMYASESARGGVLEASGIVEIKYRMPKLITTMERLDVEYNRLRQDSTNSSSTDTMRKIKDREELILPVFQQAATELADLHDRPERMLSKRVIKHIVDWKSSRTFFYYKLSRRIKEVELVKRIITIDNSITNKEAIEILIDWFQNDYNSDYSNDKHFLDWEKQHKIDINYRIEDLKHASIQKAIISLGKESPAALVKSVASVLAEFNEEEKQLFLSHILNPQ